MSSRRSAAAGTHARGGAAIGPRPHRRSVANRPRVAPISTCNRRRATAGRPRSTCPWVVEELDAAADAAGVDRLALFAASVEELSSAAGALHRRRRRPAPPRTHLSSRTTTTSTPATRTDVVAIEWAVEGEPRLFTLGLGPWLSVGWNDAGLSVTGNEVAPNDERVGIPRLLLMRDVVRQPTLDDAIAAVAPSCPRLLLQLGARNTRGRRERRGVSDRRARPAGARLVHANHYAEPAMQRYEAKPGYESSRARHRRAAELLAAGAAPGEILRDHEAGICRHGDPDGTKTVFWCVADVRSGRIEYGRGTPCDSEPQVYELGRAEATAAA